MGLMLLAPLAAQSAESAADRVPDRTWFYPHAGQERASLERHGDRFLVQGEMSVAVTGSVLVRVSDEDGLDELASHPQVARLHRLEGPYPTARLVVTPEVDPVALSRELHDRFDVRWAHPDFRLRLQPLGGGMDDTFWDTLWHLDNTGRYEGSVADADIDGPEAWVATRGEGTVVAVLDTGVDPDHEDLEVLPGYDYVDGDDDPRPEPGTSSYEHGTAMAGIAAARGNNGRGVVGVAWEASVLPIRLVGGELTTEALRNAFIFAADQGADVLSNSWSFSASTCPEVPLYAALQEGIDHAVTEGRDGLGSVVVFGSGNGGCDVSPDGLASYEPVVLVGATSDRDEVFGYSNYGAPLDLVSPSGPAPDGEGEYVRSTDIMGPDGYSSSMGTEDYSDTLWGTSASTPMVAGTLALMFSANPALTGDEARTLLCATADRVQEASAGYDEGGWSERYGCGRVNAAAAVQAALDLVEETEDAADDDDSADVDDETTGDQGELSGCACAAGGSLAPGTAPQFLVALLLFAFACRRRPCSQG